MSAMKGVAMPRKQRTTPNTPDHAKPASRSARLAGWLEGLTIKHAIVDELGHVTLRVGAPGPLHTSDLVAIVMADPEGNRPGALHLYRFANGTLADIAGGQ